MRACRPGQHEHGRTEHGDQVVVGGVGERRGQVVDRGEDSSQERRHPRATSGETVAFASSRFGFPTSARGRCHDASDHQPFQSERLALRLALCAPVHKRTELLKDFGGAART